MNKKIYDMLNPLLVKQSYIKKINIYNDEHIDINFDIVRDLPLNLLFDNVRYGFHVAGGSGLSSRRWDGRWWAVGRWSDCVDVFVVDVRQETLWQVGDEDAVVDEERLDR